MHLIFLVSEDVYVIWYSKDFLFMLQVLGVRSYLILWWVIDIYCIGYALHILLYLQSFWFRVLQYLLHSEYHFPYRISVWNLRLVFYSFFLMFSVYGGFIVLISSYLISLHIKGLSILFITILPFSTSIFTSVASRISVPIMASYMRSLKFVSFRTVYFFSTYLVRR